MSRYKVSKFLFCLCSLVGTREQQCTGQTWTGLQPKLCLGAPGWHRRAGAPGCGAPAAVTARRGCARAHGWVTVSQASLLSGRQNESPFQGEEGAAPLLTQLSPIYHQRKHFPPCLSMEREKNQTSRRLLCIYWLLCSLWRSARFF